LKKRFNTYFPSLFIFGELMVVLTMFFAAFYVSNTDLPLAKNELLGIGLSLLVWVFISSFTRDFKIGRAVGFYHTFKKAFRSVFLFISCIALAWVLIESEKTFDRHFLTTFFLLLFVWISIYRVTVHLVLDRYRTFGGNIRRSVIVGYDQLGFDLFKLLSKRPQFGIRVKGFFSIRNEVEENFSYPLLGTVEQLFSKEYTGLDFIYISDKVSSDIKTQILDFADENLIKVKLLPEIKLDVLKSLVLRRYEHISVIDLNQIPLDNLFNRLVKRSFDIVFSLAIVLLVMSWLYPIIGVLIKWNSRGPILFKQRRHGANNEVFNCYKFRTMVKNDEADEKWATKDDYRITRIGRFLRRSSIDELPQVFNVLLGQMSVVGPRPHPIKLNESYQNRVQKYANRHSFKPGITGLAQSMGFRGEIKEFHQMNSRVRLDRFYLQNWSFWLDIKIITKTIISLYKGQDLAY